MFVTWNFLFCFSFSGLRQIILHLFFKKNIQFWHQISSLWRCTCTLYFSDSSHPLAPALVTRSQPSILDKSKATQANETLSTACLRSSFVTKRFQRIALDPMWPPQPTCTYRYMHTASHCELPDEPSSNMNYNACECGCVLVTVLHRQTTRAHPTCGTWLPPWVLFGTFVRNLLFRW